MQIVLDVPDQYLLDDTPESLATRFKLMAALMLFRSRRLSAGAASQLAGVDRYTFIEACKEHAIPVVAYPPGELEAEFQWLSSDSTD